MSIVSTLALMTTAIVAKLRRPNPSDVEITRLQAEIDNLKRERDEWRKLAENWRRRFYENERLEQQQQVFQNQMQYAQAAQAVQQFYCGMQNQAQAPQWCNCVPARHDMFLNAK